MKKTMITVLLAALSITMACASAPQSALARNTRHLVNVDSLPSKRTCGIDVSRHQGNIDWQQVAQTKVAFVYVKATEGASLVDPCYKENIKGAKEAGFKVGAYHFLRTTSSVHDQFNNFINTVGEDDLDLIPIVNVEEKKNWSSQELRDSLRVFVDLIDHHFGCKPIIYTGERFYNDFLGEAFNDCMLNVAKYTENGLRINRKWQLWQFSENGGVSGIKTPVDLNALDDRLKVNDIMLPEKLLPEKH